jgi:hypothetical protein
MQAVSHARLRDSMQATSPQDILDVQSALRTITRDQATLLNVLGILRNIVSKMVHDAGPPSSGAASSTPNSASRHTIEVQRSQQPLSTSLPWEVTHHLPADRQESPVCCVPFEATQHLQKEGQEPFIPAMPEEAAHPAQKGLWESPVRCLTRSEHRCTTCQDAAPSIRSDCKALLPHEQRREACTAHTATMHGNVRMPLQEVQEVQQKCHRTHESHLATSKSTSDPPGPLPCMSPHGLALAAEASKIWTSSAPADDPPNPHIALEGSQAANIESEKGAKGNSGEGSSSDASKVLTAAGRIQQAGIPASHEGKRTARMLRKGWSTRASRHRPSSAAPASTGELPLSFMQIELPSAQHTAYGLGVQPKEVCSNKQKLTFDIPSDQRPGPNSNKSDAISLTKARSLAEMKEGSATGSVCMQHETPALGAPVADNQEHLLEAGNILPHSSPAAPAPKRGAQRKVAIIDSGLQLSEQAPQESFVCGTPPRRNAVPNRTCIPDTPSASEGENRACPASQKAPTSLSTTTCLQHAKASPTAYCDDGATHDQHGDQNVLDSKSVACTRDSDGQRSIVDEIVTPQSLDSGPACKTSSCDASCGKVGKLTRCNGTDCVADCHGVHHAGVRESDKPRSMGGNVVGHVDQRATAHVTAACDAHLRLETRGIAKAHVCIDGEQIGPATVASVEPQRNLAVPPKSRIGRLNIAQERLQRRK